MCNSEEIAETQDARAVAAFSALLLAVSAASVSLGGAVQREQKKLNSNPSFAKRSSFSGHMQRKVENIPTKLTSPQLTRFSLGMKKMHHVHLPNTYLCSRGIFIVFIFYICV